MKHKKRFKSLEIAKKILISFNYENKKIIFKDTYYWLMYINSKNELKHITHY